MEIRVILQLKIIVTRNVLTHEKCSFADIRVIKFAKLRKYISINASVPKLVPAL